MEEYSIIQKPAIKMIGIECKTSNNPEAAPKDIPKLWDRFYSHKIMDQIPNKTSNQIVALYCDYEGDYTQPYTLIIGCPVSSIDDVPEGMTAKIIPEAKYAHFRAIGEHPKIVVETWGKIWTSNLKRTYTGDFEIYEENYFSKSPQEADIFVSIES